MVKCPNPDCHPEQPHVVKNGQHRGKQRYRCKNCGFTFTKRYKVIKIEERAKAYAVKLHFNGEKSYRSIAKSLNKRYPISITHVTVYNWIWKIIDDSAKNRNELGTAE